MKSWRFPMAVLCTAVLVSVAEPALAVDVSPAPFEGEKSTWHNGFVRYDYLLDIETLKITPFKAPEKEGTGVGEPAEGKRRCIVIAPKEAAPGRPWSWQGCYWNHEPQTEIELLKRGFHVAYISANHNMRPDAAWDAWYSFLTEKHGLSPKPAFVGMSRGGEFSYVWATSHPKQVSCIYADNPGSSRELMMKINVLADQDVPILHVCGSIDPLLDRFSNSIEGIYRYLGGRISVMIKDGAGHHPHSLRDATQIADFITESVQPRVEDRPAFVPEGASVASFYSSEAQYKYFPKEEKFITCRGPLFTNCYRKYAFPLPGVEGAVTVIAPVNPMPGKPWVFRSEPVSPDAAVDLALLEKGFHVVTGPVSYNQNGPLLEHWNAVYRHLTGNGFSSKPVMEGTGGAAGDAYAWAIANPDKVSCIYAENPILSSTMAKTPIVDSLEPLSKARVPLLHVCGASDPLLGDEHTRRAESRYKDLGGTMDVIVDAERGHYPAGPENPKAVVDFILKAIK